MNIRNNTISERQCFRSCLLENIAIPMIVVPYVTMRFSGFFHTIAFILGLLMFAIYAWIIWKYVQMMPEGLLEGVKTLKPKMRCGISVVYIFRYCLRSAVVLVYFANVTHHYMLRSVSPVMIILPFVFICGYGAIGGIEKRGRLLELLFWWMIIPLIMIAVFVVSNTDWITLNKELIDTVALNNQDIKLNEILKSAYYVVLLSSSIELMLYTVVAIRKHRGYNVRKIVFWIIATLAFSYVFIFGVLGQAWVGRDSMAAFNVMEAADVPFGLVQRMDYAVLAFWIIGVFAMISGYMFYAKQYGITGCGKTTKTHEKLVVFCICMAVFVMMLGLQNAVIRKILLTYLIVFDLLVSLLIPVIINNVIRKKTIVVFAAIGLLGITLIGCGKRYESKSVEKRDYVKTMTIKLDGEDPKTQYFFTFQIVNLEEYTSNGTGKLQTDTFSCSANSIEMAIAIYFDENGKQLDLGHMEEVYMDDTFDDIIEEFSIMPFVPKSINVYEDASDGPVTLREKIRELFSEQSACEAEFIKDE